MGGRKTSKSKIGTGGENSSENQAGSTLSWTSEGKPDFSFRPSTNIAARGAGYGQIARVPGRR